MGKGKVWSSDECLHLAEAWLHTSEDEGEPEVKGTNQDSTEFWSKVVNKFAGKGPPNPDGIYKDRQQNAIMNHWKDKIARDIKKFNKALLLVFASKPTGVTEQEKVNIAVALHLKKADSASSRHKDFQPHDWKFYKAWLVLKEHRAFIPPSPQQMEDAEEIEDEEGDDLVESTVNNNSNNNSNNSSAVTLFTTPIASTSRGPGPGARKTKAKADENEYKKKKAKIHEELLEVQKKKQKDFAAFVENTARAQAFKMAVLGFNTLKDSDPGAAAMYKESMQRILSGASALGDASSDADSESDNES